MLQRAVTPRGIHYSAPRGEGWWGSYVCDRRIRVVCLKGSLAHVCRDASGPLFCFCVVYGILKL